MRRRIGILHSILIVAAVLGLVVVGYYWFGARPPRHSGEPAVTEVIERLGTLTPEQRRDLGRQAEEAAKSYGK